MKQLPFSHSCCGVVRLTTALVFGFTILVAPARADISPVSMNQDTWANWERRLDRSFQNISPRKVPGRAIGIVVPSDTRTDLMPMTAIAYQSIAREKLKTIVFIMPAPDSSTLSGLAIPGVDNFETSIGTFHIDQTLAALLQDGLPTTVNTDLFYPKIPALLENQLATLKYILKGKAESIKILPVMVKFTDLNSQAKDIAPAIAEKIKDASLQDSVTFVVMANVSQAGNESQLIAADNNLLAAVRNLDLDAMIDAKAHAEQNDVKSAQADPLALAMLLAKWLGGDHGEILAYAHSGQLVLTKNKQAIESYISAAFASGPPYPTKIPHVDRARLEDIFDELLRGDLLNLARQTCASVLDTTAAKPATLNNREAARAWPAYVSLYAPDGKIAGQAGSYLAVAPLEESIRRYAFDAVREAQKKGLTKENFKPYVVDVSIPYGFSKIERPEDLIPFLNGIIVEHEHKKFGFHPDAWRTYPDPHQLLGAICVKIGLLPWAYETSDAKLESFRTLSFNEKEPFQTTDNPKSKKRKKKAGDDTGTDDTGGTGGDAGTSFGF